MTSQGTVASDCICSKEAWGPAQATSCACLITLEVQYGDKRELLRELENFLIQTLLEILERFVSLHFILFEKCMI